MRRQDKRVVHISTVHHLQDPRIFRKELCTLSEAGYNTYFLVQSDTSELRKEVKVQELPKGTGKVHRLLIQWDAYREAVTLDADCYHIHDPELIPLAYLLKRQTNGRVIYDMHEDYRWHGPVTGRLIRSLEKWCFRWVDHVVVANAPHVAITESIGVPTTRIANYYKPVDGEQDPSKRQASCSLHDSEPIRMIYTGVMGDGGGRGLSQLVDLASRMQGEELEVRLRLVGVCYVDADRRRAERRIQREDLEGILERVGWDTYVPWEQLVQQYTAADIGVVLGTEHPNQIKKIPTKFYEYLHYGLPIICTNFPVWRQFIERHNCGAVVPSGGESQVLDVIRHWRKHPGEYRRRSDAALQAAQDYRWKSMGQRLIDLYDDLLGASRRQAEWAIG